VTRVEPRTPEFSRPVDLARLGREEALHEIAASEAERAALARRFGLLSLDRFEARVRLRRLAGGMVRLAAAFEADLVQECVITLEPVPSRLEERFSLVYGALEATTEVILDEAEETVEPLEGDRIDIGEAVAQQLSLALDPYPRAPDAALDAAPTSETASPSPFAALAERAKKG
jgi:uncharacterized metal-binding protein YceD (DUF177 family)